MPVFYFNSYSCLPWFMAAVLDAMTNWLRQLWKIFCSLMPKSRATFLCSLFGTTNSKYKPLLGGGGVHVTFARQQSWSRFVVQTWQTQPVNMQHKCILWRVIAVWLQQQAMEPAFQRSNGGIYRADCMFVEMEVVQTAETFFKWIQFYSSNFHWIQLIYISPNHNRCYLRAFCI